MEDGKIIVPQKQKEEPIINNYTQPSRKDREERWKKTSITWCFQHVAGEIGRVALEPSSTERN